MILACFVLFGRRKNWPSFDYLTEVRTDTQYLLAGVMGIWLAVWGETSPETTLEERISQETPGVVENVPDRKHFGGVSIWREALTVWMHCRLSGIFSVAVWSASLTSLFLRVNTRSTREWTGCFSGKLEYNEWIPWRGIADGHIVFILHSCEQKTIVGCTDEIEELDGIVLNGNGL